MITLLPFKKPYISHVPYDNCVLGVLQNYSQTYDWIYTNFINIYINQQTGKDYFYPVYLWKICPFLDEFSLPFCFIRKLFPVYTDFLEYCLCNKFYVYNILNIKYIMKYNVHINDVHNSFVYGIDSEKRVVKLCDFYKDGVYESHDCSYDEINKAFSPAISGIICLPDPLDHKFLPVLCSSLSAPFLSGTTLPPPFFRLHQAAQVNQIELGNGLFTTRPTPRAPL